MKVFDVIPGQFFRILTGRNRNVYVEILLSLRKAFKNELYIEKDNLVNMFAECLEDLMIPVDIEAELEEAESDMSDMDIGEAQSITWSAMARLILRRLRDTNWIEVEYKQRSYDEIVTIPPYSVSMIEFLYSITQENTQAYKSYAFNTYSSLKTVLSDDSEDYLYTALESAYTNCNMLLDSLKILLNNIRRFHQILNNSIAANDILKDHFEGYQVLVNERIFHPLVTKDSVLRFKIPIMTMIDKIRSNEELRKRIVSLGLRERQYNDPESGMEELAQKLYEIYDTFEGIDRLMQEIQSKNTAYTKASIDKMIYLLNYDRSVKTKLADILMKYSDLDEDKKEVVSLAVKLFRQSCIDEKSLYCRSSRKIRSIEPPEKIKITKTEYPEKDLDDFLKSVQSLYSHQQIENYMKREFGDRMVVHSHELSITDDKSFVLMLLASMKSGEKRTFYDVEFLAGYVEKEGYQYPKMRFIRKVEDTNDKPLD